MSMDTPLLKVGWHKGEIDFEVSCSITDMDLEDFSTFREMLVVAIGTAEDMWRRANAERYPSQQREGKP